MKIQLKKNIIGSCLLISIAACSPPDPEEGIEEESYFRLGEFLDNQYDFLKNDPPGHITKTIKLKDDTEEREQTTEEIQEVLNTLRRNDINLPAYQGLYDVSEKVVNDERGLHELAYTLNSNADAPVRFLNVYYYPEKNDSVAGIAAFKERVTPLYHSYQISTARFRDGRMLHANIINHQQILRFQPTRFTVTVLLEE